MAGAIAPSCACLWPESRGGVDLLVSTTPKRPSGPKLMFFALCRADASLVESHIHLAFSPVGHAQTHTHPHLNTPTFRRWPLDFRDERTLLNLVLWHPRRRSFGVDGHLLLTQWTLRSLRGTNGESVGAPKPLATRRASGTAKGPSLHLTNEAVEPASIPQDLPCSSEIQIKSI